MAHALHELHCNDPNFKSLKHIAGTSLVVLEVPRRVGLSWLKPWIFQWPGLPGSRRIAPDSRRSSELRASLEVHFQDTTAREGTSFAALVSAKNIGRAVWLPSSVGRGSVLLGCHLLDHAGKEVNRDFARSLLEPELPEGILPGEVRSFPTRIPAPPKGRYILEFDLVAEHVSWFARMGSPTVRVPVEVV